MRIRIRDPEIFLTLDPEWQKFRSGVQDKHPGFAKLVGSLCFWASTIRVRILSLTSKKIKINHDFYCFVTSQRHTVSYLFLGAMSPVLHVEGYPVADTCGCRHRCG
jgi:hypothetical protein